MTATVRALFVKRYKGGPSEPLPAVHAVTGGFEGDRHTGSSKRRQILLMSGSVLDELRLEPGTVFENVVVDGLDVMSLKPGQRLHLGEAVVSVTIPCEPCVQMDRVRHGLQEALQDRRGMFVEVISPGIVSLGDPVEIRM